MNACNNHGPDSAARATDHSDTLRRIVSVSGPTAVGKTSLGIALALALDGEVVNVDSRYVYRGFDIGVSKPGVPERKGVPHHLIDILPPEGEMSLARFQDLAFAVIDCVLARGRLPILVGGTPLYMNAVVENWRVPRVPPDPEFRAALEAEATAYGVATLARRLRGVDAVSAERCGSNLRRIIRALEVHAATGRPMSEQEGKGAPRYQVLEIGLRMPREALYAVIDRRAASQIANGLAVEVRGLLKAGIDREAPAMGSIGYRQMLPYLSGESTLEEALERIRFDTHRYVRHQETWLRRNLRLQWFDVTEPGWEDRVARRVQDFLSA